MQESHAGIEKSTHEDGAGGIDEVRRVGAPREKPYLNCHAQRQRQVQKQHVQLWNVPQEPPAPNWGGTSKSQVQPDAQTLTQFRPGLKNMDNSSSWWGGWTSTFVTRMDLHLQKSRLIFNLQVLQIKARGHTKCTGTSPKKQKPEALALLSRNEPRCLPKNLRASPTANWLQRTHANQPPSLKHRLTSPANIPSQHLQHPQSRKPLESNIGSSLA